MATTKRNTPDKNKNNSKKDYDLNIEDKAVNPVIMRSSKAKKNDNRTWLIVGGALLLIIIVVVAIYFTNRGGSVNNAADPDKEAAEVTTEVRKVMIIPEDEVPSVATVLDVTKLSDQPFFRNAVNGDKLLLYTNEKKAILYRPSTRQIVEVMPLILDQDQTGDPAAALPGTETSIE